MYLLQVYGTDRPYIFTSVVKLLSTTTMDSSVSKSDKLLNVDVYSDSILKYLKSEDGININLTSIGGGKIKDICQAVSRNRWLKSSPMPEAVVIHVGTNDLVGRSTVTSIAGDFAQLLKTARYYYNCPVIVSGILPRRDRPDVDATRKMLNIEMGSISASMHCTFHLWDDKFPSDNFDLFSIDGLHPSRKGNVELHKQIRNMLHWHFSEERTLSKITIGQMITKELALFRRRYQVLRKSKKEKRRQRMFTCQRPQPCRRTHVPQATCVKTTTRRKVPHLPQPSCTLMVHGVRVQRPKLSGWRKPRVTIRDKVKPMVQVSQKKKQHPPVKEELCPFCKVSPHKYMYHNDRQLLDHFLQVHRPTEEEMLKMEPMAQPVVQRTCSLRGGGEDDDTPRGQMTKLDFVATVDELDHTGKYSPDIHCTNISTCTTLPPLTQLQRLQQTLEQKQKQNAHPHYVHLKSGKVMRLQEISEAIQLYKFKNTARQVQAEKQWLNNSYLDINAQKTLSPNLLAQFENIIFNNTETANVIIDNHPLPVDDLVTLTCNRWLSNSIILHLSEKVSNQVDDVRTIYVQYSSLESLNRTVHRRIDDLSHFINNPNKNPRLVFNFLVRFDGSSTSIDVDGGNHFVFAVYYLKSNKLVYADTKGWPIPNSFIEKIQEGVEQATKQSKPVQIIMCHDPTISSQHTCGLNCSNFYPLQTCNSVCGIASIVGFTMCVLRPDLFDILVEDKNSNNLKVEQISYLRQISQYSSFLRRVVIQWILSPTIDISLILKQIEFEHTSTCSINHRSQQLSNCNSKLPKPLPPTNVSPKSGEQKTLTITSEMKEELPSLLSPTENTCIEKVRKTNIKRNRQDLLKYDKSILQFLKCKPTLTLKKNSTVLALILRPKGTHSTIVKKKHCDSSGMDDETAIQSINDFLNSDECKSTILAKTKSNSLDITGTDSAQSLFAKPYVISKLNSNKLQLRCFLKNGQTLYKSFKSNSDESDICRQIHEFVLSKECLHWIQDSLDSAKKPTWTKLTEIKVGRDLKHFFDKFKFDVLKFYDISKHVHPSYEGIDTLNVSITNTPSWGRTHRLDEHYVKNFDTDLLEEDSRPVVSLIVKCAGKSSECRTACGHLLSDIDRTPGVKRCSACSINLESLTDAVTSCSLCDVTSTAQWYKVNKSLREGCSFESSDAYMCNACYRYIKTHGTERSCFLKTKNATKHTYSTHFQCQWQLKCQIYSNNLNKWVIYTNSKNSNYHQQSPVQVRKRPCLSDRDEIDKMRVVQKSSANQIKASFQRKNAIHVQQSTDTKYARENTSKSQIQRRLKVVDRHLIRDCIKKVDDVPLTGSDWRNAEKILESNIDSVLFFQRGFKSLKRHYHIVISNNGNLEIIRKFGEYIMGYDNKYDFMSVRFPVGLLTVSDQENKGRAVAFGISNSDHSSVHAQTISIVLHNVPCHSSECEHKQLVYVFNDGNGFFKYRPCSINNPISPHIQHDKDPSIKAAVTSLGLKSSLCNFHGLQALRRFVNEDSTVKLFIRPLETGFKSIMRSWNSSVRKALVEKYTNLIKNDIPEELVPIAKKNKLINYFENNWFFSNWSSDFTSEVIYQLPPAERRNPLIYTDNITERKFRDIDETIFNSQLNRLISVFLIKMIDQFLYSEKLEGTTSKKFFQRTANIRGIEKEIRCAEKGIHLQQDNRLIIPKSFRQNGWLAVRFENESPLKKKSKYSIPDLPVEQLTECYKGTNYEEFNCEYVYTANLCQPPITFTNNEGTDHSYDVASMTSKCKQLLSRLEYNVAFNWHNELLTCIPERDKESILTDECQYVCNIYLGVCSCYGFICKGQPHFCKHLYAALSLFSSENTANNLVEQYKKWIPSLENVDEGRENTSTENVCNTHITMNKLLDMSRLASSEEIKSNTLLALLHDKSIQFRNVTGRPAFRQPHNLGNRRFSGPIKEKKYSLVNYNNSDSSGTVDIDPYRPDVAFPDRAKERHGGRKRNRLATRQTEFKTMVKTAFAALGVKLTSLQKKLSNTDQLDSVSNDEIDHTENDIDNTVKTNPEQCIKKQGSKKAQKAGTERTDDNNQHNLGLILCKLCVSQKKPKPFSCSNQLTFNNHLAKYHSEKNMLCRKCWEHTGSLMEFSSLTELKKHDRDVHKQFVDKYDSNNVTDTKSMSAKFTSPAENVHKTVKHLKGEGPRKLSKLSLKRKVQTARSNEKSWKCPTCQKQCTTDPPSIGCDRCDRWYHFKCVGIHRAPDQDDGWYCKPCQQKEE